MELLKRRKKKRLIAHAVLQKDFNERNREEQVLLSTHDK
jgi:hypothetical protein